jgi:peptidoglycan/LPS O-acetylase OafA/YrhL
VTPTEAVLLSVLLALSSYVLVERPFLRRKERLATATVVTASEPELTVSGPLPATTQ